MGDDEKKKEEAEEAFKELDKALEEICEEILDAKVSEANLFLKELHEERQKLVQQALTGDYHAGEERFSRLQEQLRYITNCLLKSENKEAQRQGRLFEILLKQEGISL